MKVVFILFHMFVKSKDLPICVQTIFYYICVLTIIFLIMLYLMLSNSGYVKNTINCNLKIVHSYLINCLHWSEMKDEKIKYHKLNKKLNHLKHTLIRTSPFSTLFYRMLVLDTPISLSAPCKELNGCPLKFAVTVSSVSTSSATGLVLVVFGENNSKLMQLFNYLL